MADASDSDISRSALPWHKRVRKHPAWYATCLVVVGLTIMCVSWLTQGSVWMSSALSNAGIAFMLFAPFYWFTERLNASVQRESRETRRTVAAIESYVEQVEQETKRRIDDLSAEVADRLAAEENKEKELIDGLRTATGDEDLEELLLTAHNMNWVSSGHPPRLEIDPHRGLWLAVDSETSQHHDDSLGHLSFQLLQNQQVAGEVCWYDENSRFEVKSLVEVMTAVGTMCRREGFAGFDAGAFLAGFADLLTVASNAEPEGRPVVAQFGSDWLLTNQRIYKHTRPTYSVPYSRFDDPTIDWVRHINEKPNADIESFEEAYGVAQLIFPNEKFGRPHGFMWGN
ncbi:hypothetical protein RF644_03805 [Kocuria sp. CPCC 205258]|uniref:hypothetical protein n=1 Tax=Kocuria sp. CPCC 205258 TaxID=3073552 RepID=UPI0034D5930D